MRLGEILRCDDGHGRLPWLGHVECANCERVYRKAPERCGALRRDPSGVLVICGGDDFQPICAKCFAGHDSTMGSYEERGELGSPGYADS